MVRPPALACATAVILLILVLSVAVTTAGGTYQSGACNNPADLAVINGPGFDTARSDCTVSCAFNPILQQCLRDCLVQAGLSSECADCFAARDACVITNCFSACMDPGSQACLTCINTYGCDSTFDTCSGLAAVFADGFESGDTSAWSTALE